MTASKIIPLPSINMILLCWPIISTQRDSRTLSPISLVASKSKNSTRSRPDWRNPTSTAPLKCLRSSMQSMGGFCGFSPGLCVIWMRGEADSAERRSRYAPLRVRICKVSSHFAGWCTFSMRAPTSVSSNSVLIKCSVMPSSAIICFLYSIICMGEVCSESRQTVSGNAA